MMAPDDPRHGSDAGAQVHWQAGEKPCPPCAKAATRARKAARVRHGRGVRRWVPLGEEAYKVLTSSPPAALAAQMGVRPAKVSEYRRRGPGQIVHARTRARILAAQGKPVTPTAKGCQRRLRALAALGWSARAVADISGVSLDSIKELRRAGHEPEHIRRDVAARIVKAYDALSMTLPPPGRASSRVRGDAARNGWSPPLAWDDDRIDHDPRAAATTYKPPARRDRSGRDRAELIADWITTHGWDAARVADELGITRDALWRWCKRRGRRDLWRALSKEAA
jgi:hypothetical protein